MYHYIVKNLVRKSFQLLNERKFDELTKPLAQDVKHSFAGDHALGGVRHDLVAFKAWLERLGRIMPRLQINIVDIIIKGWPQNTLAIVRWVGTSTLNNGDPYLNKGVHFITIKWGKLTELEVYEDSQAVSSGLEKQHQAGILEAKAPQIIS